MSKRKIQTPEEWELLATPDDVIGQACEEKDGALDSMALTAYASAMFLLAEYGVIEIQKSYGRRVIARRLTLHQADVAPESVASDLESR